MKERDPESGGKRDKKKEVDGKRVVERKGEKLIERRRAKDGNGERKR